VTNRTFGATEPGNSATQPETGGLGWMYGPTGHGEVLSGHGRIVSGANETHGGSNSKPSPERQVPSARRSDEGIDNGLVRRAQELLETLDAADEVESPLLLDALRSVVLEMWDSASESSEVHQGILAVLENGAVIAATHGSITPSQLSAFREALTDLSQPRLVLKSAESIRRRFVDEGFNPLSFAPGSLD